MHKKTSIRAFVANKYIEYGFRRRPDEDFERILEKRRIRGRKPYKLPVTYMIRSSVREETLFDYPVIFFNEETDTKKVIFYLHGGAFTSEITLFHLLAIDRLVHICNARAVVPIYPLIPFGTYKDTIEFVEKLYNSYINDHPDSEIYLMGDSAGGGLSLTMCEIFSGKCIKPPKKTIVFSPWLDVSMSNPRIADYEERDVFLYPSSLRFLGKKWAAELDTKDFRVSPRFGDLSALSNTVFFVGTEEIFYPDVTETCELMRSKNIPCNIYIGEGRGHAYPIFPIPEGHIALDQCAGEILGD